MMSDESHSRIYLDAHATTSILPKFFDRYRELSSKFWANPSSIHAEGRSAKAALMEARQMIISSLRIPARYQVYFFATATEALNTLIRGVAVERLRALRARTGSLLSTSVEHAAVFETIQAMARLPEGSFTHKELEVGKQGAASYDGVVAAIEELAHPPLVAAIMAVNNETGVITSELAAIAEYLLRYTVPLIVDGVSLLGRAPLEFHQGISAYIFSGHKIHAPKGVAIAVVEKTLRFDPLIFGGPQEHKKRAGTENVPLYLVAAEVLQNVSKNLESDIQKMKRLQDKFEMTLLKAFPDIFVHGKASSERVPSVSNIFFPGVRGEDLLIALDLCGVAASHGSACSSGALEPSRVLLKMGCSHDVAGSSLRFSWSAQTTDEMIDVALRRVITTLRSMHHRL